MRPFRRDTLRLPHMPTSKRFTAGVTQGGPRQAFNSTHGPPYAESRQDRPDVHGRMASRAPPKKKLAMARPHRTFNELHECNAQIEDPTATTRFVLLPLPTAGDAPGGLRAHTGGTPPGPRRQLETDKSNTPSAPPARPSASQCPTNCICIPPSLRHPAVRRRPFNSRP